MNQETLNNFNALLDEREKAIFTSPDPKAAAIKYLIEIGYLDGDGNIAERFKEGLPDKDKAKPLSKRDKKVSV